MRKDNQRHAATVAFEDAGREITQAFDVMGVNLTLAAGTLAALLAVIGAGELFAKQATVVNVNGVAAKVHAASSPTVHGLPKFTSTSLLLLAVALPLVVRFFVRATFGYQQLLRFNRVRDAQWRFLSGQHTWEHARGHYDVYVVKWRSPASLSKLLEGSAKYGFVWVFVLYTVVLAWAFYTAAGFLPRVVAGAAIGLGLLYDFGTLRGTSYFTLPTGSEVALTVPDVPEDFRPDDEPEASRPPAAEQTVFFFGRRRPRRNR